MNWWIVDVCNPSERGYHIFYFLMTHVVDLHETCHLSDDVSNQFLWGTDQSNLTGSWLPSVLPRQSHRRVNWWQGGDADHGRGFWHPGLPLSGEDGHLPGLCALHAARQDGVPGYWGGGFPKEPWCCASYQWNLSGIYLYNPHIFITLIYSSSSTATTKSSSTTASSIPNTR